MFRKSFKRRSFTNSGVSNTKSIRDRGRSSFVVSPTSETADTIVEAAAKAAAATAAAPENGNGVNDEEFFLAMDMAIAAAENPDLSPEEIRKLVGQKNKQIEILDKNPKMKEIRLKEEEELRKRRVNEDEGKKYRQLLRKTQQDTNISYPSYEFTRSIDPEVLHPQNERKHVPKVREVRESRSHVDAVQPRIEDTHRRYSSYETSSRARVETLHSNTQDPYSRYRSCETSKVYEMHESRRRMHAMHSKHTSRRNTIVTSPPPPPQAPQPPKSQETVPMWQEHDQKIEIAPGVQLRLRGAKETWDAIARDFFVPVQCFGCSAMIFCIQDASHVVCPKCRTVGPLEASLNGLSSMEKCGGVGLGFTSTELATWQEQISRESAKKF